MRVAYPPVVAIMESGLTRTDYLRRIALADDDLDGLSGDRLLLTIAQAQHRSVPFENLRIHCADEVSVDPRAIAERLVGHARGGICYEVNGLLALGLAACGVDSRLFGARVDGGSGFGPADGHMAVGIMLGAGEWRLIDVGFGGEMVFTTLRSDDPHTYDVGVGDARYRLDPRPRDLAEFAPMAHWHSTSDRSRFTGSVICTLPDGELGRRTLAGRIDAETGAIDYRLIRVRGDRREEFPLRLADVASVAAGEFGMPDVAVPAVSTLSAAADIS